MKNFKKLSRNDLKKVSGGKACVHYIQGSKGEWIKRDGECVTTVTFQEIGGISVPIKNSYCDTGLGQVTVTSNGGQSRC